MLSGLVAALASSCWGLPVDTFDTFKVEKGPLFEQAETLVRLDVQCTRQAGAESLQSRPLPVYVSCETGGVYHAVDVARAAGPKHYLYAVAEMRVRQLAGEGAGTWRALVPPITAGVAPLLKTCDSGHASHDVQFSIDPSDQPSQEALRVNTPSD